MGVDSLKVLDPKRPIREATLVPFFEGVFVLLWLTSRVLYAGEPEALRDFGIGGQARHTSKERGAIG